jgi:hypothetical protein
MYTIAKRIVICFTQMRKNVVPESIHITDHRQESKMTNPLEKRLSCMEDIRDSSTCTRVAVMLTIQKGLIRQGYSGMEALSLANLLRGGSLDALDCLPAGSSTAHFAEASDDYRDPREAFGWIRQTLSHREPDVEVASRCASCKMRARA